MDDVFIRYMFIQVFFLPKEGCEKKLYVFVTKGYEEKVRTEGVFYDVFFTIRR